MAIVKPFRGLRPPTEEICEELACLPYDVMNSEEATHRRKRPHHHQENHERKGRPRPAREQKERPAPEVAPEQDADAR